MTILNALSNLYNNMVLNNNEIKNMKDKLFHVSGVANRTATLLKAVSENIEKNTVANKINSVKIEDIKNSKQDVLKKYSFDKTLTITTDWTDIGISGTSLLTGSYILQIIVYKNTSKEFEELYTAAISWFNGQISVADTNEMLLHKSGAAVDNKNLFLRTTKSDNGYMNLQIAASKNLSQKLYSFNFIKLL